MDRISLKPALLASRISYDVTPRQVTRYDKDGTRVWQVDHADLAGLNHVTQRIASTRIERLILITDKTRRTISFNASYRRAPDDPDHAAFRSLLDTLSGAINTARPDLRVTVGQQGGGRIAMFAIGLLTLLAGIGFGTAAIVSGVSMDRMAEAAVPMLCMVGFGAYIAWLYRPLRRPETLPIASFAKAMQALARN